MDRLLENDTRTCVRLTRQEDSDAFLDFLYPERLLLPKGTTLATLLGTLESQGHVTMTSTKSQNTDYVWTGFPKAKKRRNTNREAELGEFFNNVRSAVYEACGVTCFEWDAQSATKPLDGAYAARKPDITCYFRILEGGSKRSWEHVVMFCEVKNQADAKREKESFLELAGKASCLMGAQDGRHSVSCIHVLGSSIYLTMFHRSGSISTCAYDINSSPLQFLRILIGVSLSDYQTIGFDVSIKWSSLGQDKATNNFSDSEHDIEPQPESEDSGSSDSDGIPDSEYGDEPLESKDSQPVAPISTTSLLPRSDLSDTGSSQDDEPSSDREGKGSKWVEVTDLHGNCCRILLKSVLAISDSLVGRGSTVWEGEIDGMDGNESAVVVKDSWIDPLRKYTEGMILHILEQYCIEGVPTLVSEEQVKTQLRIPGPPYPLVNSSTHFFLSALPSDSSFHLRLLSRLVTRPVGKLILEFSSLGELLVAFLDYVVAHKNAFERAGILHRDISPANLFLTFAKHCTHHSDYMQHLRKDVQTSLGRRIQALKRRGVLGDWGYATKISTSSALMPSKELTSPSSGSLSPDGIPTSPVESTGESVAEYDNRVLVRGVGSHDVPQLLSISKLTNGHDIVLLMGTDDPNEDPRRTIDVCPLNRMGTWSWMSAQLVMAGPGQPVIHDALHDLESFFYVLVGICTLYDGPFKQKSENDLTECYDKFFNTFEPSVLKTITIQSDLTWIPSIVKHIHPYFKPLIPLLTKLRSEIILPLATDKHGNFYHKHLCNHNTFIKHIITTLSELKPADWEDMSLKATRDSSTLRPSLEVTAAHSESQPPEATLLLAPPTVPKNLLPGCGAIRSDPGVQRPTERNTRRTRESDSDDFLPSSPLKRTRLEPNQSLPRPRFWFAHSTSELPTRPSTRQHRLGIGKSSGQ